MGRDYASIPDASAELNQHGYIIVEGHTRVLALTGIGLASLGMNGAWNWRGQNRREGGTTRLPDREEVAIAGQHFAIARDGDVRTNAKVRQAGERLARWLTGRGPRAGVPAPAVELLPPLPPLLRPAPARQAPGREARQAAPSGHVCQLRSRNSQG